MMDEALPPPPSIPLPPPPPPPCCAGQRARYDVDDGRHEVHGFDEAAGEPDMAGVVAAVGRLAERVGRDPPSAKHVSVYKGRAGVALALLRAVETGAIGDAAERKKLLDCAVSLAEVAANAYENMRPGAAGSLSHLTFLEGAAGAFAVRAATRAAAGGGRAAFESAMGVLALAPWVLARPPEECELLYGRAGYLQAILFLRARAKPLGLDSSTLCHQRN